MEQIIKLALSTRFATELVDSLYEVAQATGNPEVALSKLLGLYEKPYIFPFSACRQDAIKICVFKSFNPFSNEVTYTYEAYKTFYNRESGKYESTSEIGTFENSTSLLKWNNSGYTEEDYKNELAVNAYEAEHC